MKFSKLLIISLVALSTISSSCDTDEPVSSSTTTTTNKKEVKPEITKVSSTSTTSDFTVTFRVKSVNRPSVSMKYSSESAKTTKPSLNKSSSPKCINVVEMKSGGYSWYYYKTTHTGFRGGNYIYYQITASNNKGSDKSTIGHCIIKR